MKKPSDEILQDGRPVKSKLSPKASGSGPVWDLRQGLKLTRKEMAARLHCSVDTIRRAEKEGRGIVSSAVKANFAMPKTKFNYQPSSVYDAAVTALQALLEAEDVDRVRRACADVTSEINKKEFARINGLTEAKDCSITRMMLKPVHDREQGMILDCMDFIDHPSLWLKDGKPAVYLSEVYQLGSEKMKQLLTFCDENNLRCLVQALPSAHFPGAAVTIIIYKKDVSIRVLA